MIKRIYFSVLLAASGTFIIHPVFAEGDEQEEPEVTIIASNESCTHPYSQYGCSCGSQCAWSLDSTGKLTIWGTGENGSGKIDRPIHADLAPWYDIPRDSIKSVVFEEGFEGFPAGTYYSFSGATSLTIPSTFTSVDGGFSSMNSLVSLEIPDSVTTIGNNAFSFYLYKGSSLTELKLSENLKTIGDSAFSNLSSLEKLVIPDSVETIGNNAFGAYYGGAYFPINALKELTLGQNLKTIGDGAFQGSNRLTEIIIPDSVETIGNYAFGRPYARLGSDPLENLILGKSVKTIGDNAFSNAMGKLTSLDIPDSVETIGSGAFKGASSLTSLILGKNLKTIGEQAFAGASKLKELIIPESVTSIAADAFQNSGIEKLYCKIGAQADMCRTAVPNAEVFEYTFKDGYYYDRDGKCYASLQNLSIGKDIKRIYTVEEAAAVTKPQGNTFKIRYR